MPETATLDRPSAKASTLDRRESRRFVTLLGHRETRFAALITALAAVGVLASGQERVLSVLNFGLIAAIAAIGLNLAMGTTGIMSLGHAVFVGFGAFTGAVLADHGWPFLLGALGAMVVAALASLTIGPLALRLSGLYLAVGTIGIAYVGEHLFVNLRSLTGGGAGRIVESPTLFGIELSRDGVLAGRLVTSDMKWFILLCLVTLVVGVCVASLSRLRWGRALAAIRDNENSASAAGIAVTRARVTSFAMSAALGGLAGRAARRLPALPQPRDVRARAVDPVPRDDHHRRPRLGERRRHRRARDHRAADDPDRGHHPDGAGRAGQRHVQQLQHRDAGDHRLRPGHRPGDGHRAPGHRRGLPPPGPRTPRAPFGDAAGQLHPGMTSE